MLLQAQPAQLASIETKVSELLAASHVEPVSLPKQARTVLHPPRPTPIFTGRQDILAQLEACLLAGGCSEEQRRYILHGLGGCGKTQIALTFIDLHRSRYEFPTVSPSHC
jgi:hypothetical protein